MDIELDTDLVQPGRTDLVEDTVDYRLAYGIAKEIIEGVSVKLIETLAERMAERLLNLNGVNAVTVRISKRPESMRPIDAAAVEISRKRA